MPAVDFRLKFYHTGSIWNIVKCFPGNRPGHLVTSYCNNDEGHAVHAVIWLCSEVIKKKLNMSCVPRTSLPLLKSFVNGVFGEIEWKGK